MHPEHHAEIEQQKSRYTCGKWNILVFFYLQPLLTGAKDGAVVRALGSRQCGPGSNPGVDAICGLSLLLVLSFAPRGFSPGTPVFPSPQKPNFSNFQFDQESGDEEPVCGCVISKSNHIYFFIHSFIYCYYPCNRSLEFPKSPPLGIFTVLWDEYNLPLTCAYECKWHPLLP